MSFLTVKARKRGLRWRAKLAYRREVRSRLYGMIKREVSSSKPLTAETNIFFVINGVSSS